MTEEHTSLPEIKEKALLIGIHIKGKKREPFLDSLEELDRLADTAGLEVVDSILVSRDYIDSKFVIGTGKAEELKDLAIELKTNVIIFDEPLSPVQEKNLRKFFEIKLLDRTELILDIFAFRASSYEAKIQIELAQLKYLLPRLTRMWVHLSRQIGGVGVRGPGETQIEIDRRRIREKIHLYQNKLKDIAKQRMLQRQARTRSNIPRISLVGYTNAGKTSLMNLISGTEAKAEDQLFCTLDSLSRQITLPDSREILITDTVGFIQKLPHFLVEAFKSTLEEVVESDILLHLVDASDKNIQLKISEVEKVLHDELNIENKPTLIVFNKTDMLEEEELLSLKSNYPEAIFISVHNNEGLELMTKEISRLLSFANLIESYMIPMNKLNILNELYQRDAKVLEEEYTEDGVLIKAEVSKETSGRLAAYKTNI